MGTVPTNAAFKKITSNNITDDYIQLIRGSDKTVLLWVDAAGIIQGVNNFEIAAAGSNKSVQFNNNGPFGGDSIFVYDKTIGQVSCTTLITTAALTALTDVIAMQPSPATSLANFNSGNLKVVASAWNGAASVPDIWTIQDVLSAGSNPSSTLTFAHSGPGGASISFGGATLSIGNILSNQIDANGNVNLDAPSTATALANFSSHFAQLFGSYWTGSAGGTMPTLTIPFVEAHAYNLD